MKRAKGRAGIISTVIWAASPGNYNFMLPREPPVRSKPITGGRNQTERRISACAVKSGCHREGPCLSIYPGERSLAKGVKPLRVHEILKGQLIKLLVTIPKEFLSLVLLLALELSCSLTRTCPPCGLQHAMDWSWEHKRS